jgi:hypothetical protein
MQASNGHLVLRNSRLESKWIFAKKRSLRRGQWVAPTLVNDIRISPTFNAGADRPRKAIEPVFWTKTT